MQLPANCLYVSRQSISASRERDVFLSIPCVDSDGLIGEDEVQVPTSPCCGFVLWQGFFIGIQSAFLSIKGISLFRPPLILCLYGALLHGVNIILAMVFPKLKYAK